MTHDNGACVCGKPRDARGWMAWGLNQPPSCNHYPNGVKVWERAVSNPGDKQPPTPPPRGAIRD